MELFEQPDQNPGMRTYTQMPSLRAERSNLILYIQIPRLLRRCRFSQWLIDLLMKTALRLLVACPSACPRVFAGHDRPCAGLAADRGEVIIMERAVRDIVLCDVVPDVLRGPPDERVDLDEAELGVPADDRRVRPCGGLVAPDAGYPAPQA